MYTRTWICAKMWRYVRAVYTNAISVSNEVMRWSVMFSTIHDWWYFRVALKAKEPPTEVLSSRAIFRPWDSARSLETTFHFFFNQTSPFIPRRLVRLVYRVFLFFSVYATIVITVGNARRLSSFFLICFLSKRSTTQLQSHECKGMAFVETSAIRACVTRIRET